MFSLRFSFVTVRVTSEPAGITAPFVPFTDSFTVAVIRSPTLLVFVHTSEFARRLNVVPAAIVPLFVAVPAPRVTVLPLFVFVGADDRVLVAGRLLLVVGAVFPAFAGTSVSCGCAAVSLPANARSRLSVVSAASALSAFFLSPPHAAKTTIAPMSMGTLIRPAYLVMKKIPRWESVNFGL
jgi:hypothetical protein